MHVDRVRSLAWTIRERGSPDAFRCYNVDLSREFRYCLERERSPIPGRDLSTLSVSVPPLELREPPVSELDVDGESISGSPESVVASLQGRLDEVDPDVLVLDTAELVPRLYETAEAGGVDLDLGRRPGWQQLAGESTYESYGRVGHSPARYNLPGRAIVDRSNTFVYHEANLHGCLDLVERSWKPLQELGWASIGNILTAIQIREARDRGVLVPWRSWRHEFFKPMATLHDVDRCGYTFAPEVGLHEDVHELDFSSLYPNIICTRNVSPERVRCDCHADREDVPGLGYSICDEPGYLPAVLQPLIDDRDAYKAELRATDDPERQRELDGKIDAIKWILVSCFGYQGFSNAKFGQIECHESINAFAREILLDAKEMLEAGGWRVVHGIVDSLWVQAMPDREQTPLEDVAREVTDEVGIALEYEAAYDWIAFVPQRDSEAGALTKYFGSVAGEDAYKYRGIECRQRSTPPFVERVQRELIEVLDETRNPEDVCDRVGRHLSQLRAEQADPAELVIDNRASKRPEEYHQYTRTVAALERADDVDLSMHPGQDVSYVVMDDDKRSRDRVRLACENPDDYDAAFYADRLLRAAESVLAPLDWRRIDIGEYLADQRNATLAAYGGQNAKI